MATALIALDFSHRQFLVWWYIVFIMAKIFMQKCLSLKLSLYVLVACIC